MAGKISLKNKGLIIAPSLLSADPLAVSESINSLGGLHDWIHVDVMDGHFVPNISYGPALVSALKKRYPAEVLDVHLMVDSPENFIEPFAEAGADYLTVHVESTRHLHRLLCRIKELGCKPGVTLNPATPVEIIRPVLHLVDMVLVMSVNPGFGGQTFIPEVMEKITSLCRWRILSDLDFLIEIDGGIGIDNIQAVVRSGCDVLVMGSAILGKTEPAEEIMKMRKILKEEGLDER